MKPRANIYDFDRCFFTPTLAPSMSSQVYYKIWNGFFTPTLAPSIISQMYYKIRKIR